MTVDGFGFGTLTGESCLKNVHCHTDRASWDAILVTVVAFGALMWKTCAQSHRFGLGRVGVGAGGGDTIGGGGVGEPRTGIIYNPPAYEAPWALKAYRTLEKPLQEPLQPLRVP